MFSLLFKECLTDNGFLFVLKGMKFKKKYPAEHLEQRDIFITLQHELNNIYIILNSFANFDYGTTTFTMGE